MQGKTTFILTDRDTGKVVEKREEHNIVTNAIKDIFEFPSMTYINGNTANILNYYVPMYNNLLHGLVLFGDNIPEKTDDYLIYGRYNIIATAGSEYVGSDAMRGSFNASQSGEIENGYRFVWDFAPEKAIGTIKCASLTNIIEGNTGANFPSSSIMISVSDLTANPSSSVNALSVQSARDYFLMMSGKNHFYYYTNNNLAEYQMTFRKYYIPDMGNIGVTTPRKGYLEKEYYGKSPISTRQMFVNEYDKKIYFFNFYNPPENYSSIRVQMSGMDIETGECSMIRGEYMVVPSLTGGASVCYGAIFNNQLYVFMNGVLIVSNLDGTLVSKKNLNISTFNRFFVFDGRLWINGKNSISNTYCEVSVTGDTVYFPLGQLLASYSMLDNPNLKCPFVMTVGSSNAFVMLRTDYLATINNLSEPLEKIDRHALQVRYEITN